MEDWVQLTTSDGHFLDEISAALRDAKIEFRLIDPVEAGPRGARTSFGVKASATKVVEVPRDKLAEAQSLLREIFDGAEDAARRESGAPSQTAEERDEEAEWRREMAEKSERSARRWKRGIQIFFGAMIVAIVATVILAIVGKR